MNWTRLWWLLCAHALTDYVLQTELMATRKRPRAYDAYSSDKEYGPWWWWMTAHGLINALGVLYVTQSVPLSIGEFIVHCALDSAKCQGWIDANTDQVGHLLSKMVWAL